LIAAETEVSPAAITMYSRALFCAETADIDTTLSSTVVSKMRKIAGRFMLYTSYKP
jgi:hypothetical protein